MNPFRFVTADCIVFGSGRLDELGGLAAELGRTALVVSNADRSGRHGVMERLQELLTTAGVAVELFWLRGEPEIGDVDHALDAARRMKSDLVIGIGGGSALDTAKAVAALLTNGGSCLDYMEVIGEGRPIRLPSAPWIAVPTTAGTGAEVTRNAVIGSRERGAKASIRSPLLLPRLALVDPQLGVGVSPEVTARSGMDALTQCIESYTSTGAGPLTDPLALEGIGHAAAAIRRVVADGGDLEAREAMALAALISGITLTNAGLGAVHGFAAPLGAAFPIPHGTVCAALLPPVMRANVAALRSAGGPLSRYAEVGRRLAGDPSLDDDGAVDAGVESAAALVRDLRIPGLGRLGVTEDAIPDLVTRARRASSMKFNPVELDAATLSDLLRRAL
jgi:alcohol dehydrogenase class IV